MADIYALGFQELDLTAGALLLGDETRAAPWEKLLHSALSRKGAFTVLASKQLVGMLLCVFVRSELASLVRDVQCDVEPGPSIHSYAGAGCWPICAHRSTAVGIMGIMGNKGGVAVRFALHDSTIAIVNTVR